MNTLFQESTTEIYNHAKARQYFKRKLVKIICKLQNKIIKKGSIQRKSSKLPIDVSLDSGWKKQNSLVLNP